MTTIRSGAPRVAAPAASSTSSTSSSSSAATGSGVRGSLDNSSFTPAATASSSSAATGGTFMDQAMSAGKAALKDASGADKDAVLKYLDNKNPSKDELKEGLQAFANLKASGDLSADQLKDLSKAMVAKSSAKWFTQQMLSMTEKMLGELKSSSQR
ncbi:MAG: hypothetical protein QM817_40455 [Archangium sp.]